MDKQYTLQNLIESATKAIVPAEEVNFIHAIEYSFSPLYTIPFDINDLNEIHITLLPITAEIQIRFEECAIKFPELRDPKYVNLIKNILRTVISLELNDAEVDMGLKFHLAKLLENIRTDVLFINGISNRHQNLNSDLEFIEKKKEEYEAFKQGETLEVYWQILDLKINETKSFSFQKEFINLLEIELKKIDLIDEASSLSILFSQKTIEIEKIKWKSSQLSLIFMVYMLRKLSLFQQFKKQNFTPS